MASYLVDVTSDTDRKNSYPGIPRGIRFRDGAASVDSWLSIRDNYGDVWGFWSVACIDVDSWKIYKHGTRRVVYRMSEVVQDFSQWRGGGGQPWMRSKVHNGDLNRNP